jgi:opacity protein-like surface antigen
MNWALTTAIAAMIATSSAGAASAQSIGGNVYATYGATRFAASETFETITGTSRKSGIGVGGNVTGLWRGLFVDIAYSQRELLGERVFIDGSTVYPLGLATRITLRPIDLAGGWRFRVGPVSPYAGAGLVSMTYRESSDFAGPGEDADERKSGALVIAGADVRVIRFVSAGGEFRYRAVQGVLGTGGVSQAFDEDQLGGMSFALRLSVGR